jgi:hypothetical protein
LKLRYGMRIGGKFAAAGTEVEVLAVSDSKVQACWPGIAANPESHQVAVQFAHLDNPTLIHIAELGKP